MEPKIKLFGSKIMFPDVAEASEGSGGYGCDSSSGESGGDDDGGKILQAEEEERVAETSERDELERNEFSVTSADEPQNPGTVRSSDENPNEEGEAVSAVDLTNGNDGKNMQQKPLKKPDKILPCPRCNSMDTKFCYYNNYNINQPRHFCKSCQRYWTAGGMMRNLPVGAGRRKTKNSSSHCHHIAISEALGGARMDDSSNPHLPAMKAGSTVLSFSPDSSLCESIASGLKLADKRAQNGPGNGVYNGGKIVSPVPCMNKDSNGGDASGKGAAQVPIPQNLNGFSSPVPCIPSVAWTYPMNPAVPIPAIYPMPFFPPPYWNCAVPNPWVVPWLPVMSPPPDHNATNFAPASPLGKHSRNGELLKSKKPESEDPTEPEKSEGSIVVPKTLRVGDPEEAAKSSIWKTLGIKYDSLSREGLFKALQPKDQKENAPHSTSQALQANPAALSRSMTFQETA